MAVGMKVVWDSAPSSWDEAPEEDCAVTAKIQNQIQLSIEKKCQSREVNAAKNNTKPHMGVVNMIGII
ncbi:hypothetical protein DSO57_1003831 [Entomophthora muscae]|uniref:Uncharacterized protein n=1 Tax=Entomophthora muscae TaxID=34485 RepID=A0ACC2UTM4_9FUNG|nr:hypothetical protein DSO57_1003831 [Entomophthora muscae]